MPTVANEYSIVYGSTTIGGTTDALILNKITLAEAYPTGSVEADVLVTGATEAAFTTACAALEAAFRTPRQRLRVILGAATLIDWNPSDTVNTGFYARPSIAKPGSPHDTARSRLYRVRVELDFPADLTGQGGRRDSAIEVAFSPSRRRTLRISGSYTALTTNLARAQYNASIAALRTAVIAGAGGAGTYELTEETATSDDADKACSFVNVLEEVLANQSAAGLDHAAIVRQRLTITRDRSGPGDSDLLGPVTRLVRLTVQHTTWIDRNQTTDLESLWTATIRPWLVDRGTALAGGGSVVVEHEAVTFDQDENRISATLNLTAATASLIEATVAFEQTREGGAILTPVWDGNPYARHEEQGPRTIIQRLDETVIAVGTPTVRVDLSDAPPADATGVAGRWVFLRDVERTSSVSSGLDTAELRLVTRVRSVERQWAEQAEATDRFLPTGETQARRA